MPQLSPAPRALALRGWSLVPGGDSDVAHHVVTPDWQGTKAPLLSPSGWEEGWTRPAPPLPCPASSGLPLFVPLLANCWPPAAAAWAFPVARPPEE